MVFIKFIQLFGYPAASV